MQCGIHKFVQRFITDKLVNVCFDAFGSSWRLSITQRGSYLGITSGATATQAQVQIAFGQGEDQRVLITTGNRDLVVEGEIWGARWRNSLTAEALQSHPDVNLQGCLRAKVRVLFQKVA